MEDNNLEFLWQQTYATLFATTNKLQAKADATLNDLTSRQLMLIISILHLEKKDRNISYIARMMGTTKQSTKQIVDVLKQKQYIEAQVNPEDKRSFILSVTQLGKEKANEDYNIGMQMFEKFFKVFTEEELLVFWTYLKKLYSFDGEKQVGYEADGYND